MIIEMTQLNKEKLTSSSFLELQWESFLFPTNSMQSHIQCNLKSFVLELFLNSMKIIAVQTIHVNMTVWI